MRIVFAGSPPVAAKTLRALIESQHEVVAVITRPDAPVGRKRVLTPTPVAQLAKDFGLPVIKSSRLTDNDLDSLAALRIDVGIVVAYGSILSPAVLSALPLGWLNLHYSLLPKYRGAAPVQRAILRGERETGVTLFKLDAGMDTGPILGSVETQLQPRENAGALLERLAQLGISLLLELLPQLASGFASFAAQDLEGNYVTAPKITRADAKVDWRASAQEIANLVLAMNPEPVAHASIDGQSFRILDAIALGETDWTVLGSDSELAQRPGGCTKVGNRVLVRCARGTLLQLTRVQPAGKNEMDAMDWWRGLQVSELQFDD